MIADASFESSMAVALIDERRTRQTGPMSREPARKGASELEQRCCWRGSPQRVRVDGHGRDAWYVNHGMMTITGSCHEEDLASSPHPLQHKAI